MNPFAAVTKFIDSAVTRLYRKTFGQSPPQFTFDSPTLNLPPGEKLEFLRETIRGSPTAEEMVDYFCAVQRWPVKEEWRTMDVVSLSQSIIEGNSFDRLPVLADALEEGGCDDVELLDHLRVERPKPHACVVVQRLAWGRSDASIESDGPRHTHVGFNPKLGFGPRFILE